MLRGKVRLRMEPQDYLHLGLKEKKESEKKAETREGEGEKQDNSGKSWEGRVSRRRRHFLQVSQVLPRG